MNATEPQRPRFPPEPPTERFAPAEAPPSRVPSGGTRWLVIVCVVASMIALGLASYAVVSSQDAETAAHKSEHVANEATKKAEEGSETAEEASKEGEEAKEEAETHH